MSADVARQRQQNFVSWMKAEGLNANKIAQLSGVPYTTINTYENTPAASMKGDNEAKIAAAYGLPVEAIFGSIRQDGREPQKNFIAEWRRSKGIRADDFARGLKTSLQMLEMWEAGDVAISAIWLLKISDSLGVGAGLLMRSHPDDASDLIAHADSVSAENRPQAIKMLKALG